MGKQKDLAEEITEVTGEARPIEQVVREAKKQKISVSYTLKSYHANMDKLAESGLLEKNSKDWEDLERIYTEMTARWIKRGMTN